MGAGEVLGLWRYGSKTSFFDWQLLVQRSEKGGMLECRKHGKRWSRGGSPQRKNAKESLWHWDYM